MEADKSNKRYRAQPAYTLNEALEALEQENRESLDVMAVWAVESLTDGLTVFGERPTLGPQMILGGIAAMAASGLQWEEIERVIEATKEHGLTNYKRIGSVEQSEV